VWNQSRFLQMFVARGQRRMRWRVKPVTWGVLMLAILGCLLAGLALWGGLAGRVAVVDAGQHPPAAAAPAPANRPLSWPVWQEGGATHVPPAVEAIVTADLDESLAWGEANLLGPGNLEAALPAYFSGRELERRRQSTRDARTYGLVGIVFDREEAAAGVRALGVDQTGREATLLLPLGRRQAALYRLADGTLVDRSQALLPAVTVTYRLVFEPQARRWLVDEEMGVTP
jgi:hypothetical protein